MNLTSDIIFRDYLQLVTGVAARMEPAPVDGISKLPLYLREQYQWRSTRIFDHEFLLAVEHDRAPDEEQTPTDFVKQARVIAEKLGREVVFVLHPVPSFLRNRLVHAGVSFIVPGSQLFLPSIPADLRERFPRVRDSKQGKLPASAQVVVLYQLTHGGLDGLSQQEIAGKISYTPMMVSLVRDQLESHGLCAVEKHGRSISLRFPSSSRELWAAAKPWLTSPVSKSLWITGDLPDDLRCAAGITALSSKSMLQQDAVPTYAILHKTFTKLLESGRLQGCPSPHGAHALVETWRYDPLRIAGPDLTVDAFSLYLSLESDPDERVQQELGHMMENLPW